jgi:selenocysteine lyase/cysteine desulfurase
MDRGYEFPQSPGRLYLNHAAVAPWPRRTVEAVQGFALQNASSAAAPYRQWLQTEQRLREQLRILLNAGAAEDVALLKNTSEALSVVAYGMAWREGDNVVTTDQEFPSNRIVWESLAAQGVELRRARLIEGATPEDALFRLVDARTRILTVSSVQYATGLRMDLERLGAFCKERGVLLCVDAIQSVGALRIDVQALGIDFLMADGHKWMLGPEGVAAFYCRPELRAELRLLEYGWHMVEHVGDYDRRDWEPARSARRFECGSPNMLGIHALAASLSVLLEEGPDTVERQVVANSERLLDGLRQVSDVEIVTPTLPGRFGGIVSFRLLRGSVQALFGALTEAGVVCALRGGNVRFSPHFYTPTTGLDAVLQLVRAIIA